MTGRLVHALYYDQDRDGVAVELLLPPGSLYERHSLNSINTRQGLRDLAAALTALADAEERTP